MLGLDGLSSPSTPASPTTPPTQHRSSTERPKSRCAYCGKELANKRNLELHHNICKHSPSKHRRSFRCDACPLWIGYSEQARTEHAKTKAHLANAHRPLRLRLSLSPSPSPVPSCFDPAVSPCVDAEANEKANGSEDIDVVGPHPLSDGFTLSNHQAACLLLTLHRGCPSA